MENQPQPSPVTFTLVKNSDPKSTEDDIFKADIPLLTIHPNDQVEFRFINCKNPVIVIPVEGIFTENRATEGKDTGIIRMNVRSDAKITGVRFPYMVFSPDTDVFAEGNSPPRMILEKRKI